LLILNTNNQDIKDYDLNLSEFAKTFKKKRNITDVFSGDKIKPEKGIISFKIKPHGCILLKI
jgi:hypothetical protein